VSEFNATHQERAAVSMAAGGAFVIAWNGQTFDGGESDDVYARVFNADGTEATGFLRANTYTALTQTLPDVSMADDGSFVVAWQSNGQDGDQQGIFAQAFNADGTRRGSEVAVNQSVTGFQVSPCVAFLADGSYVVAWESEHISENFYDTYARRFTADGAPLTGEFRVNVATPGYQGAASCCALPSGGYAFAWQSNGAIGAYLRVYNAANAALTGEIRASAASGVFAAAVQIRSDANGNMVLAWQQSDLTLADWDIFARQYTPSGGARGAAFQLNTSTSDSALAPAIGVNPDGDFVAAWHVESTSLRSVWVRLFVDTTPPPTPNNAPVLNTGFSHTLPSIIFHDEDNAGVSIEELLGESVTDVDPGAVVGLAVLGVNESEQGRFEYSIDGGESWSPVPAVSDASALLLGDASRVRFAPHPGDMGTITFTFRAWDQTSGVVGGTADLSDPSSVGGMTAFSLASDDASITITNPAGQGG
jgi:hypothetical protein